MPLLNFWNASRSDVLSLNIEQVVSNAGNGVLKDNNLCSTELRAFLKLVPNETLFSYARHCLEASFNKSGYVLQDVANELGRRLDFEVENGLYQGRKNAVGHDGIWRVNGLADLVIEVKTELPGVLYHRQGESLHHSFRL